MSERLSPSQRKVLDAWAAGHDTPLAISMATSIPLNTVKTAVSLLRLKGLIPKPQRKVQPTPTPTTMSATRSAAGRSGPHVHRVARAITLRAIQADAQDVDEPAPADGVTLLQLDGRSCRWPHGEPGSRRFLFCGKPTDGRSYCALHRDLAYVSGADRKKAEAS